MIVLQHINIVVSTLNWQADLKLRDMFPGTVFPLSLGTQLSVCFLWVLHY